MERKKYTTHDEEENIDSVCESAVGALAYSEAIDQEEDWEDRVPVLEHATLEELMADIDQSEQDFKAGKGVSWDTVKGMIENRIRNYAR